MRALAQPHKTRSLCRIAAAWLLRWRLPLLKISRINRRRRGLSARYGAHASDHAPDDAATLRTGLLSRKTIR